MCTILVNDIDYAITYAYLYPFIRIPEPFILDKITQLDLNLLNQINPLLGIFYFFLG